MHLVVSVHPVSTVRDNVLAYCVDAAFSPEFFCFLLALIKGVLFISLSTGHFYLSITRVLL